MEMRKHPLTDVGYRTSDVGGPLPDIRDVRRQKTEQGTTEPQWIKIALLPHRDISPIHWTQTMNGERGTGNGERKSAKERRRIFIKTFIPEGIPGTTKHTMRGNCGWSLKRGGHPGFHLRGYGTP